MRSPMRWNLLFILIILSAQTVTADPFTTFSPKWPVSVQVSGPAMDAPANKGKEFYSEWWAGVFRLKGGYYTYIRFMVYNLGPGDEKLKINATFKTPDQAKYSVTRTFKRDEWHNGPGLAINADGNVLQFAQNTFTIKLKNKKFLANLQIKPRFAPWRPGNGLVKYGTEGKYYALDIPLPLGDVKGSFTTLNDKKVHQVSGVAYIDHQAMNAGMHVTTRTMYRFRRVDDKKVVFLWMLRPPPQFGDHVATCLAAFLPGSVVQAVNLQVFIKSWWQDPKDGGYRVPKVLMIKGMTRKGLPLRGAIVMKALNHREEYLKSLNAVERFIVSRFANPIEYDFDAVMAVEVGTGPHKKSFKTEGTIFFTGVNH